MRFAATIFSALVSSVCFAEGYAGHGQGSVAPEVLERYRPKALETSVADRIQLLLDVRTPGLGMVSPNGRTLFFGWKVTGVNHVFRLDSPMGFPVQMTGGQDSTTLVGVTPDGKWLVLSRDKAGQEYPGLYLQSTKGGPLKLVAGASKVQVFAQRISDDGRTVYFSANDLAPDSRALYAYDLATEKKALLFSEPGLWSLADIRGGRFLLSKATGSRSSEYFEFDSKTKVLTPLFGQGETVEYSAQYGALPGEVLVQTDKFGEFRRLYSWNAGKWTGISPEQPRSVDDFNIDLTRKHIVYEVNDGGYTRLFALDAKTKAPWELPRFPGADHVTAGAMTRDGRYMSLGVSMPRAPRTNYIYDFQTRLTKQWVLPSFPETDPSSFVPAALEEYPARDGTKIPMFVRRPEKCRTEVCPVVVHFHGGPEGQSIPGFSPVAQMFVEAGFIFVEPNVRGSDGYGKSWLDRDNGPKRLEVITDIEDCAKFIKSAWARGGVAPKVGVMGWSYGGYSTLMAMTYFAGAFDAGTASVGMSNLVTFLQNTAPYRRALRITEYGDPERDRDALVKLSPITYVDRVKSPLLILQGANDPRVPAGEAVQIQESLAKRGIASELILFADEGHGASKRDNQVLELGHMVAFFQKHLK